MDYAAEIKQRIPATELLPFYGVEINRAGFARCPFHGEKTGSLKAYPGDRGFYCFGCHASGTVIDFVMKFFGLPFKDAVSKINDDFRLGFPIGEKMTRQQRLENERRAYMARREREQKKKEKRRLDLACDAAFDKWKRLDDIIMRCPPEKTGGEILPEFAEALRERAGAEFALDCAEIERYEYERQNC